MTHGILIAVASNLAAKFGANAHVSNVIGIAQIDNVVLRSWCTDRESSAIGKSSIDIGDLAEPGSSGNCGALFSMPQSCHWGLPFVKVIIVVEGCAFPGLRNQTWGTHFRAEVEIEGLRFVLSHPFARNKAKGRGTDRFAQEMPFALILRAAESAGRRRARGGLESESLPGPAAAWRRLLRTTRSGLWAWPGRR